MPRNAGDYVKSWGAALIRGAASNPEFTVHIMRSIYATHVHMNCHTGATLDPWKFCFERNDAEVGYASDSMGCTVVARRSPTKLHMQKVCHSQMLVQVGYGFVLYVLQV